MRPPPLPYPPGLGKLAKQARANGGAALEVLADAWETLGGEMALEIAAELRARDWAFISQRERPRWALRRVIGRSPVNTMDTKAFSEILKRAYPQEDLIRAFYRPSPFLAMVPRKL